MRKKKMADDVARALGASDGDPIKINGKDFEIRGLAMKELVELQRECLKRHQRQHLEAYRDLVDLMPEEERSGLMAAKLEEVSKWTLDDLPAKTVVNPSRIKLTAALRKRVQDIIDVVLPTKNDNIIKVQVAAMIDNGMMTDEEYKELVGQPLRRVRVNYVDWWMTTTFEGMLCVLAKIGRGSGVTEDDILKEFSEKSSLLTSLVSRVETLSVPSVGNG